MDFFATYQAGDFGSLFKNTKVVHVQTGYKEETDTYFRQLASQAGIPMIYEEDPVTGQIHINKWTEIKYESDHADDSYKSSNKSQPLHTDYGYFSFEMYAAFFYCVAQADFGGSTHFIDVDTVVEILSKVDSRLYSAVQDQKVQFGRAENPLAQNTDYILQNDALGWKINWNYYRALGDTNNKTLVEDFHGFLETYIERSGELKAVKLQPGEGVFFQDRRVLHGRASFVGFRQLNKGGIAITLPKEVMQLIQQG